jgi:hypothetical protein
VHELDGISTHEIWLDPEFLRRYPVTKKHDNGKTFDSISCANLSALAAVVRVGAGKGFML